MKVIVAIWEHRYGRAVRVFRSEEDARQWRRDIADENWEEEIGEQGPVDPETCADRYFEIMDGRADRGEWLSIEECDVEEEEKEKIE